MRRPRTARHASGRKLDRQTMTRPSIPALPRGLSLPTCTGGGGPERSESLHGRRRSPSRSSGCQGIDRTSNVKHNGRCGNPLGSRGCFFELRDSILASARSRCSPSLVTDSRSLATSTLDLHFEFDPFYCQTDLRPALWRVRHTTPPRVRRCAVAGAPRRALAQ